MNTNLPSFNLDQFFYGYALSLGKKKKTKNTTNKRSSNGDL